jgi:hypothetical protein
MNLLIPIYFSDFFTLSGFVIDLILASGDDGLVDGLPILFIRVGYLGGTYTLGYSPNYCPGVVFSLL